MENASKALLIAAGVLIGILVLSLAIYLIITFGSYSSRIQDQNEQKLLTEFNSQFLVYEGRENLTIYDVINIANLAKENNDKYELNKSYKNDKSSAYISVKLNTDNLESKSIEELYSSYIKLTPDKNLTKLYKCKKVSISNITGRVYQVNFEEK